MKVVFVCVRAYPNTCRECGNHLVDGVCPKCGKEQEKYREVTLRIEDVPATKIADLNRGVLLPISREIRRKSGITRTCSTLVNALEECENRLRTSSETQEST